MLFVLESGVSRISGGGGEAIPEMVGQTIILAF